MSNSLGYQPENHRSMDSGLPPKNLNGIKSDGSTASYYELPEGATELQDLISHRNMNAQIGFIFNLCYDYCKTHRDSIIIVKEILYYAESEVKRLERKEM